MNTTYVNKEHRAWSDANFANTTGMGASVSLFFAPWDAVVLNVTLSSISNRTEPLLQWQGLFSATGILDYLISQYPRGQRTRNILEMKKPQSFLGDRPPLNERTFVQSDATGSSAASYGSNTLLPSIFLTGQPLITVINKFSKRPSQAIAADPALAAIFTDTLTANVSTAWAMSSLITVLSTTNYYSQQPAFDRVDTAAVSFFTDVLYPRNYVGFVLLMWALFAHLLIVAVLVVLFTTRTRFTLLGNAWSAYVQMAESQDLDEHAAGKSLKPDREIVKELKASGKETLRARIVKKTDGAEVAVRLT